MKRPELEKIYNTPYDILNYCQQKPEYNQKKQMSMEELYTHLRTLTDREINYREYQQIKDDPVAVDAFLSKLDIQDVISHRLHFPEIGLSWNNQSLSDVDAECFIEPAYFSVQNLYDILLMKHPNYSPVFSHSHNFFEAIYVLEGTAKHTISGQQMLLSTGDFCIISPKTEHLVGVFDDHTVLINLLIRKSTFEKVFQRLLQGYNILSYFFLNNLMHKCISDYLLFHTGNDEIIQNEIMNMYLEFENKQPYFSEILNCRLSLFFAELLRNHETDYELSGTNTKKHMQTYHILKYIQENYKTVSLQDVASHFNYTPEYTSRLIKNSTGNSFSNLILEMKMRHASNLLSNTNLTIANIAEDIGYQSLWHFTRIFKKYFQTTPGNYRLKNNMNQSEASHGQEESLSR